MAKMKGLLVGKEEEEEEEKIGFDGRTDDSTEMNMFQNTTAISPRGGNEELHRIIPTCG